MNANRVQEIIQSKQTIPVTCNGADVWIDSVNQNNNTATVHPVGEHNEKKQVPVSQLEEVSVG